MRLSGLKARAVIDKMKSVGVLRRRKRGRSGKRSFLRTHMRSRELFAFLRGILQREDKRIQLTNSVYML